MKDVKFSTKLVLFLAGVICGLLIAASMSKITVFSKEGYRDKIFDSFLSDIAAALSLYHNEYGKYPEFSTIDELIDKLEGQDSRKTLFYVRPTDSAMKEVVEPHLVNSRSSVAIINNRTFVYFDAGDDQTWNTADDYTFFYELKKGKKTQANHKRTFKTYANKNEHQANH